MSDHDTKHEHKDEPGRATAALFQSRAEAKAAIAALHKAKYTQTWFGTTSLGETSTGDAAVTVESGGFFSGTERLVDALVSHGVDGEAARAIEERIEPGNALVTVDPKDKALQDALDIIEKFGGRLANGIATDPWAAWSSGASVNDFEDDAEFEEELFARR